MATQENINNICKNLIGNSNELNDLGKMVLAELLQHLPPIHKGIWGPVFVPLTRLLVRTNVDLAIINEGRILLTWRDDKYFKGWHFPGGCLGPGESLDEAAQRIADAELGIKVRVVRKIDCFNNPDNHRSHDSAYFMLCEIINAKPTCGKWFNSCPKELISCQIKYWNSIQPKLY
ncbi:MAG: NUDIX hydrolase [Candidatus Yanofskybacteria bacterium]|nr:NUDIX hydrolase [Candidatus Yanofskybacteria bacterium]